VSPQHRFSIESANSVKARFAAIFLLEKAVLPKLLQPPADQLSATL
jgi:hypothetical protein